MKTLNNVQFLLEAWNMKDAHLFCNKIDQYIYL
jgi:hypothetical protein